jgi:photosystem II stability/assembly factor-like uncharacterized protein
MIAHSGDGGGTFGLASSGLAGQPHFRGFAGTSATDVWLVGDDGAGGPVALHSVDHGQSWQARAVGDATDLRSAWALGAERVLLATGDGRIFRSADAGATWTLAFHDAGARVLALWGSSAGVVYAAGAARGDAVLGAAASDPLVDGCDGGSDAIAEPAVEHGVVLRSDDGGQTWTSSAVATPGPLLGIWGRPDGSMVVAAGANTSVAVTLDAGAHWSEHGQAEDVPGLDVTDVWVGPGDGAVFFASPSGLVRDVAFHCTGSVQLGYEPVPPSNDGSRGVAAVWGPGSDDVWTVGPGGVIRHRP